MDGLHFLGSQSPIRCSSIIRPQFSHRKKKQTMIRTEGSMWLRVIVDEAVAFPVKKHSKSSKMIRPTAIKHKKYSSSSKNSNEAQLFQALTTSKNMAVPVPSSPSSNSSYESMIQSFTTGGNNNDSSNSLDSPKSVVASPVTLKPQMTGQIWPHLEMKKVTSYSPTMMGRPRAITMDEDDDKHDDDEDAF
ncbi:MAG: hypothetical protein SGILL_007855 [Bacillariaceae sp.]